MHFCFVSSIPLCIICSFFVVVLNCSYSLWALDILSKLRFEYWTSREREARIGKIHNLFIWGDRQPINNKMNRFDNWFCNSQCCRSNYRIIATIAKNIKIITIRIIIPRLDDLSCFSNPLVFLAWQFGHNAWQLDMSLLDLLPSIWS